MACGEMGRSLCCPHAGGTAALRGRHAGWDLYHRFETQRVSRGTGNLPVPTPCTDRTTVMLKSRDLVEIFHAKSGVFF